MTYTFRVSGRGAEVAFNRIEPDVWQQIEAEYKDKMDSLVPDWESGSLPASIKLPPSAELYAHDNLGHESGCFTDWFTLEVENEDGIQVAEFSSEAVPWIDEKTTSISDKAEHYTCWMSLEKGVFLEGEIDIDGDFDPDKVRIDVKTYTYGKSDSCSVVVGISYDGEDVECEFVETVGKGDEVSVF